MNHLVQTELTMVYPEMQETGEVKLIQVDVNKPHYMQFDYLIE